MAPPVLGRKDRQGHPVKSSFGRGMSALFPALSRLRVLRGTPFDLFGYSAERRTERQLISGFIDDLDFARQRLLAENTDLIVKFLSYPLSIRGYGHVKQGNIEDQIQKKDGIKQLITDSGDNVSVAAAE
jgi:indolepyruvate ferredoxin oxidoreductase